MLKNIGSNWALNAVQILVFMVLTPFVVSTLGTDLYGGWVTLVSLTGVLQLLILGIPMASVRYIAEHVAKKDTEGANRALSTCMAITLGMGAVAVVVGGMLFFGLTGYLTSDAWSLTAEQTSDAKAAFVIVVANLAFGFLARLPYGVFDAHQDFIARNLIMAGGLVLRLVLTLTLLTMTTSLVVLAMVQVLTMASEFAVAITVSKRRHTGIRYRLQSFDRSMVKRVLSFSIYSMFLNMGAMLAFRVDALVIGANRAPSDITVYDLGNKIFEPFIGIVLAIGMVVMPAATAMKARAEDQNLQELFLKWSKICMSLVLLIGGYLLIVGPEFLSAWLREDYVPESGRLLQVLMVSFLLFLPVRGVALPILMGLDKPRRPALALLVMGLVNVALSIALVGPYGLLGVALGTAIPNLLFALFVAVTACRELQLGVSRYLGHVVLRPLLGALLPAAGLYAWKVGPGIEGIPWLMVAGISFTLLYALLSVLFVYRGDPHVDLDAQVRRLIGRSKNTGGQA